MTSVAPPLKANQDRYIALANRIAGATAATIGEVGLAVRAEARRHPDMASLLDTLELRRMEMGLS